MLRSIAKLPPSIRGCFTLLYCSFRRSLCHDDSKAIVKVEIVMAVEKPRSRVVSNETECHVIVVGLEADRYRIPP